MTLVEASEKVLRDAGCSLHAKEVTLRLIDGGQWAGSPTRSCGRRAPLIFSQFKMKTSFLLGFLRIFPRIITNSPTSCFRLVFLRYLKA